METTQLQSMGLQEIEVNEMINVEGGIAPIIIVGAIYLGSAVAGGLVGYGLYKALDWALN
jgi:lactobin A/cerein 7B family class IIb bacteriocin